MCSFLAVGLLISVLNSMKYDLFIYSRVRAPRYQIIPPETDLNLPPLLHNIREQVLPIAAVRTGKGTTIWNVWFIRIGLITPESLFIFL